MGKSEFMGEVFVPLSALKAEPLTEKWFPVLKRDVDQRGGGGELKLKLNYVAKGAILTEEQMMLVPPEGTPLFRALVRSLSSSTLTKMIDNFCVGVLSVSVMRARNLQAKDEGESSDPFAEVRIVDYKARTVLDYETVTRDKTLNPDWGEKFYFRLVEKHER
jgi:hypothetical protein